jgi:hypothetical protein
MNLILHCGGREVPREQLMTCPTPPATDTWTPVPHFALLRQVETILAQGDLEIRHQAHALSPGGLRYFGLMGIAGADDSDHGLVIGLRNSHDKSFPAAIAVGSCVFVCDNLAFSSEVVIARRHTRFITRDLPELICRALAQVGDLRRRQDQRIDTYKRSQLTDRDAHDLFIRAVDARVLPVTALPRAVGEWRQPTHPEFTEDGRSAWRWFNAITEAIKGRSLDALPRRTQRLHGLLDTACGLAAD